MPVTECASMPLTRHLPGQPPHSTPILCSICLPSCRPCRSCQLGATSGHEDKQLQAHVNMSSAQAMLHARTLNTPCALQAAHKSQLAARSSQLTADSLVDSRMIACLAFLHSRPYAPVITVTPSLASTWLYLPAYLHAYNPHKPWQAGRRAAEPHSHSC